jgi:nucleoid-associated protein YgaU
MPAVVLDLARVVIPGARLYASSYVPGTIRTITVAGGDLFRIAEKYLGDAEQWNRIAALNPDVLVDRCDPIITGVVTLKIPPLNLQASNGGILGL